MAEIRVVELLPLRPKGEKKGGREEVPGRKRGEQGMNNKRLFQSELAGFLYPSTTTKGGGKKKRQKKKRKKEETA